MSGVNNGLAVRYLHAGDMEIAEMVEIGGQWKIKTRYIPGPGVDQRVAMISVNTTTGATTAREYYHADRLGNVIAMAAENGAVTANYVYTPYGVEGYGASGNPFRYTGRRWDAAVDLYYYRARYYDPELGRFLQTDPVLYADQMNLYAYVGNSPLNATDPTGMVSTGPGNNCHAVHGCRTDFHQLAPAERDPELQLTSEDAEEALSYFPVTDLIVEAHRFGEEPSAVGLGVFAVGVLPGPNPARAGREVFDALSDGQSMPTDDALAAALDVLGEGYSEISFGVYRSADGLFQVRMTSNSDLIGKGTDGVPHMNFESGDLVTTPSGRQRFDVTENKHILLPEETR